MDILFYLKILKKRFYFFVIGITIISILSVYYNYYVIKNTYMSYSTIYVGARVNDNNEISISSLNAASIIITDFREIIKSRVVYDGAMKELRIHNDKKNITYWEFEEKVFVELLGGNTRILKISVHDEDPVLCKILAKVITQNFMKNIKKISKIDNLYILNEPEVPSIPIGPNKKRNFAFSILAAIILITGLVILIELLDKKIRTKEHLTLAGKVKVIGTIPLFKNKTVNKNKREDFKGVGSIAEG